MEVEPTQQHPPGKILIVDDTPYNLKVLSNLLSQRGHEVSQALNAHQALMAIDSDRPDLILLDILMPEIDGYQLCEQLKSDRATAQIPIIFLTALDDVDSKVKALEIGGVDYITKPFHFSEVVVRVENQLIINFLPKKMWTANHKLQEQNQELQTMNERLRQTNYELTQFADAVSHNLQNPLKIINNNLQQLLNLCKDNGDRTTKDYISQSIKATIWMKQLIENIPDRSPRIK